MTNEQRSRLEEKRNRLMNSYGYGQASDGAVRVTRGLVVNMPGRGMSFHGRLFQASMWREYAMTWHGRPTRRGIDRRWCEEIGRMTYADCLRRARVNLYLAHRLNRAEARVAFRTTSNLGSALLRELAAT